MLFSNTQSFITYKKKDLLITIKVGRWVTGKAFIRASEVVAMFLVWVMVTWGSFYYVRFILFSMYNSSTF